MDTWFILILNNTILSIIPIVDNVNKLILSILLFLSFCIILFVSICILYNISFKPVDICIYPFEIGFGDGQFNGKTASKYFESKLREIETIHNDEYPCVGWERMDPKSESCGSIPIKKGDSIEIEKIKNISIGGVSVPLIQLIFSLIEFLPWKPTSKYLTGYIQKYGECIFISIYLDNTDTQQESANRSVKPKLIKTEWSRVCKKCTDDLLPELIEDIAYEFTFDFHKNEIKATNWLSFKYYSKALSNYGKYLKYRSNEDLDESRDNCLLALAKKSDYELAKNLLYNLGSVYKNLNKYDFAEELLLNALKLSPYDSVICRKLGSLYENLGRYNEAVNMYETGKDWSNLGRIFEVLKQYDKAFDAYKIIKSSHEDALKILCNSKGNDEAIRILNNEGLWGLLGDLYQSLGLDNNSIDAYKKGNEWVKLCELLFKLKRDNDAVIILREKIYEDPTDCSVWTILNVHRELINHGDKLMAEKWHRKFWESKNLSLSGRLILGFDIASKLGWYREAFHSLFF